MKQAVVVFPVILNAVRIPKDALINTLTGMKGIVRVSV